jgi:hypothetical protein
MGHPLRERVIFLDSLSGIVAARMSPRDRTLGAAFRYSRRPEETGMEARREDVESIEGIVKALYEVISGPAGARDWQRERTLLHPAARLMPTRPESEGAVLDVFDCEGYIASRAPFFAANDFYEAEVSHRVERFGSIAHVWSAYEYRRSPEGEPFGRGTNSIQLFHDGDRWWIVSVLWANEGPGVLLSAVDTAAE